ncbi:ABC transporter permease [Bacillus sp. REN3]|uniref:ABC transporter permease n=1 Tax=Bacillus sp. REN3 TaxID=2802440 RepID=UPI001AEE6AD7|nr:ABC transporter permease [Bacillus sp. REN3]
MGFWWLAVKDAKIIGRDRKALLTLVFMPILLIGILGAAFGNLMGEEETAIERFKVGIVNHDEGKLGTILEDEVINKGLTDLVSAISMDRKQMDEQLKEQKISIGLILPAGFTESVLSGEGSEVEIISIPSAAVQTAIIENVIMEFSQSAAVDAAGTAVAAEAAAMEERQTLDARGPVKVPSSFKAVKEIAIQEKHEPVSSFQYYAAGMGVMFLMMTAVTGVSAMIEEKEHDVYGRLLVSSLAGRDYLLGKFIGILFTSSIQFFIIILGTHLLFSVEWGESAAGVIFVGLAYVFSVSGLGVLLGILVNTEKAFSAAAMLGTQIMAAVGGSMVPLYMFPDWVNEVVKIFPNALTLQTFLELMSGAGLPEVANEAIILVSIGTVSLLAAWFAFSLKRRSWYA